VGGDDSIQGVTAIRGIGAWTAEYIAMRAFGEPDAFPSGDLVLRRMTGARTARELQRRSEAWRPWRAYAVMLLWRRATEASRGPAMRARRPRLALIGREQDSAAAP